ncbi:DEAD/DEAH box helicase [Chryseobacterium sp. POL2]|uniref:DEAD/DEAH box helicase n=1 Tax=Chryseobacterium sp. POL2 TaxID=2713414 RepID=UPI0013E11F00|nr:DEAD/DEAH box helicase [Chryseobacterium sp. POL2]QIG88311.1 DEAD/DEAH box helicase [Chryseobacterium sp. POL2]
MKPSFADFELPKALNEALEKLNISEPTPIQYKSFSPILSGRDIMGIAQTGTGKTLAYLLPILKEYKYSKTDQPKILILVPTRELVVQVTEVLNQLTEFINARVMGVYGGVNINTQRKNIYEGGVDILVGTPGRVMDLAIDNVIQFKDLKKLIIDEFDEMLSLGFKRQLTNIFTMMSEKRQNILFSATMTDQVDEMLTEYFKNPLEISLARSGTPLEKIAQSVVPVQNFNTKLNLLIHYLNKENDFEKILIFANNKRHADLIFTKIDEEFPEQFGVIHSNKSQNFRLRVMEEFSNNELRGIITTDIMARGLDIPDVSHVFNFEIPDIPEQYIHRIGRTGRADKEGIAISFYTPKEEALLLDIEVLMNKEVSKTEFPAEVKLSDVKIEAEKEVVIMKNPVVVKIQEGGGAFHEKKDKNKKVNLGGPTKRKPPKTKPANRGQQKQKTKSRKKK